MKITIKCDVCLHKTVCENKNLYLKALKNIKNIKLIDNFSADLKCNDFMPSSNYCLNNPREFEKRENNG